MLSIVFLSQCYEMTTFGKMLAHDLLQSRHFPNELASTH